MCVNGGHDGLCSQQMALRAYSFSHQQMTRRAYGFSSQQVALFTRPVISRRWINCASAGQR